MKIAKAITPDEIMEMDALQLPNEVIKAINDLIVFNWDRSKLKSSFNSDEWFRTLDSRMKGHVITNDAYGYLKKASYLFEQAGWIVKIPEKPDDGYLQNHVMVFEFFFSPVQTPKMYVNYVKANGGFSKEPFFKHALASIGDILDETPNQAPSDAGW